MLQQLNINDAILKALNEKGYKQATPIQQTAIPPILSGHHVLTSAETGTAMIQVLTHLSFN